MKIFIILATLLISVSASFAQEIPEPQFYGEAFLVNLDRPMYRKLPKERGIVRATSFMGHTTKRIVLGAGSTLMIPDNINIGIIIKVANNSYDPMSMIQVFRFDVNASNQRVTELSSADIGRNYAMGQANLKKYVNFTAEKYGESSYLLRFSVSEGHYGIITGDIDENNIIIATFDVYDSAKRAEEERARKAAIAEYERRERERLAKKAARKANREK